jgi:hypothetical protein
MAYHGLNVLVAFLSVYICLRSTVNCGKIRVELMPTTVTSENTMSRINTVALPVALLLSALLLSSCASSPEKTAVIEPAQVETPAAPPVETVVVPEPEPAPVVVAEQPVFTPAPPPPPKAAPKPKKKVVKRAPPPPVVVPEPAPVVQPAPAVVPPKPAPVVAAPVRQEPPPMGFFEEYWLWLLVLAIAIGIAIWWKKSRD